MKGIKKIIIHNWKLKLFSFFIGITMWFYVLNIKERSNHYVENLQNVSISIAKNIPIEIKSLSSQKVLISPKNVDIYYIRRDKNFFILPRFKAYIEYPGIDKENDTLPVQVEKNEEIVIIKIVPERVTITRLLGGEK